MPPYDMNHKVQEAFMTLNLLRVEPELMIDKYLEPMRGRFIEDPI